MTVADRFRRVLRLRDEFRPVLKLVPCRTALAHELLVHQAFGDDDMRHAR